MERTALQKLINWNDNKRRKPLIIWGARQVGKTYLVQELFAKVYYKNKYVYIDCKKEDEIKKAQGLLVKKAIAAALVFLMLSIVSLVFGIVAPKEDNVNNRNLLDIAD